MLLVATVMEVIRRRGVSELLLLSSGRRLVETRSDGLGCQMLDWGIRGWVCHNLRHARSPLENIASTNIQTTSTIKT